eukprot:Hpha_TRINITY_DN16281_c4_g1::TRINITY_DN16281_c4_g1_i2::g.14902::m.14902/K10357/MYO5; myosin V
MPPKKAEEKLNRALCRPGNKVFYWETNHAWAIGEVQKDDGKSFWVKGNPDPSLLGATKIDDLQALKVGEDKIWPVREDVLDEVDSDLLGLTELHDATIQRCLYLRYMQDLVYTNIGAIVVALNPWNFKISWYMDTQMPLYLAEGKRIKDNRPHSWAQAHNTWYELRADEEDQCILISGESGAGKTEAAKIVMKYLGTLSCLRGEEQQKEAARKIAFNINQASPILEAFGNAKTVRNDNSSRFGKFVKVQFDKEGFLSGANTIKYLLEKSRIVTAAQNERVYHSFYLMLQGKDAKAYQLGPAAEYHTNAGKCIDIPGVNDGEDYSICSDAMGHCGFTDEEKEGVWSAVAGICHLLKVQFKPIDADSCNVDPKSGELVKNACKYWKVDDSTMMTELVKKTLETPSGPVVKLLTVVQAADGRDALVKTLYDQLFGWQVDKINVLTDTGTGRNFIGLLDIFGFEDFEYNSFEQICINLANETLQNHYNNYIFNKDKEECRAEGVDVTDMSCPDNTPCLKMMTAKTGIFKLLDDECMLGKGSDMGFLDKVKDSCKDNPFFFVAKTSRNSFVVRHYAAAVTYTVEHWLDKNRDTLKPAFKYLMRSSGQDLIKTLIPEPDDSQKGITVGGFFKEQLLALMQLIESTNPHWIRCVKPHPAKKPLMVHGITCMGQLESSGVLGTVKIRKAGFPVRPDFKKFVARFKSLVPQPYPKMDGPSDALKDFCRKICNACDIEPMRAQAGKTKMFLKNDAAQKLEAILDEMNRRNVATVQRFARYNTAISLRAYKATLWGFKSAANHVQEELREWLRRSLAVREQREEQRRIREGVLREMASVRDAAISRLSSVGEWEVPSSVRPTDDAQDARIDDAVRSTQGNPSAPVPQVQCLSTPFLPGRRDAEDFAVAIGKAWYAKSGDVLDELLDNLRGTETEGESLSTLSVLSELTHQLFVRAGRSYPDRGPVSLFSLASTTMESADLDRALCFSDVPAVGDPAIASYSPRNPSMMSELMKASSAGSLGLPRWVKVIALLSALSDTLPPEVTDGTLVHYAALEPPLVQQLQQKVGKQTVWQTVTRCATAGSPAASAPPPGANVKFVISGIKEGVMLGPVSQHPAGPSVLIPPLAAFQVANVKDEGGMTVVTLQSRGQLSSTDPVLRDLKAVALQDAAIADRRLAKVRERLMERKIEAEKERQKLLAELLKDSLAALTGPQEAEGREAVEAMEREARSEVAWIADAQAALFHEVVLLWCEEDERAGRLAMQDREVRARNGIAAFLCAREAVVGLGDAERDETLERSFVERCERLNRSENSRRRKLVIRHLEQTKAVLSDIREGVVDIHRRVESRAAAMRKRDKDLQRLQKLRERELAHILQHHTAELSSPVSDRLPPPPLTAEPHLAPVSPVALLQHQQQHAVSTPAGYSSPLKPATTPVSYRSPAAATPTATTPGTVQRGQPQRQQTPIGAQAQPLDPNNPYARFLR